DDGAGSRRRIGRQATDRLAITGGTGRYASHARILFLLESYLRISALLRASERIFVVRTDQFMYGRWDNTSLMSLLAKK
ncbi:MAG: hypothetical protein ABI423_13600, partial [Burkholderiales bacterium]